jgi:hypothetical protein
MKNILSKLSVIILLFTGLASPSDLSKTDTESVDSNKLLFARYHGDWRSRLLINNLMSSPIKSSDKEPRLAEFKSLTQKLRKSGVVTAKADPVDLETAQPSHFFLSSRDHRVILKLENVEPVEPANSLPACRKPSSPMPISRSRASSLSIITDVDTELASLTNASELSQDGRLITTPDSRTPLIAHKPKTFFDLVTAANPNEDAIKAQLKNPRNSNVLLRGFHVVFARGNISPALFSLMNKRRRSIESIESIESLNLNDEKL